MKKRILLLSATLGIAYIGLTSNSAGPAAAGNGNRTGSSGSSGTCAGAGCHGGATGTLPSKIVLTNKTTSTIVTDGKYIPDQVYKVTFACSTSTTGLTKFGFQTAVTNAAGANSGTLTAGSGNKKSVAIAIVLIEHSSPISGVGGIFFSEFEWKAPAKGAGTATFYGIGNAVNGDGGTSGDLVGAATTSVFTEGIASGIDETATSSAAKIYPNPCSNMLTNETAIAAAADYSVSINDLSGRQVMTTKSVGSIDVTSLNNGVYLLQINNNGQKQIATFIKQ